MQDLDVLFEALTKSKFRSKFRLNDKDLGYLRGRGLPTVLEHARKFIAERLAPAEPKNDGKQTPWRGHPVFVSQHATATCCRGCLAKWHDIERGKPLAESEIDYILSVLARWLEQQTDEL